MKDKNHRILAVGIATIDIINELKTYPDEDSEVRAISQYCQRGGNVTNTLVVLSQLGQKCFWAGTIAEDLNVKIITDDLDLYHIDYTNAIHAKQKTNPTSYIIHSRDSASRSIVHYRDLEEYQFSDFKRLNLVNFDWIHFEGRNIENVFLMQKFCKDNFPDIKISVEVEKNRPQMDKLFGYADVLFFSKPYAKHLGYDSAEAFLADQKIKLTGKVLSCTWAEQGACIAINGDIFSQPALKLNDVVDTLAAGDTYNAAFIHCLIKTVDLTKIKAADILSFACKFAGEKCAQKGIHFDL